MASFRPRTFTEYLQVIWRRKLMIFLVSALMLISTFFVISRIPDVYESRASVVVAGPQEDRQAVATRVASITERLTSRSYLETVIERHNLFASAVQSGRMESAVGRLRKDIKVDTKWRSDRPEVLTIAYRNPNPAVAKAVATDLVSLFGKMNEAIDKHTSEEAASISQEITEVENQLGELGQRRAAAAARQSVAGRMSGAINERRSQQIAAASSIATLSDRQFSLEAQIAEQKRQIAEQQQIVKNAPSDSRAGSSYGVLLVRKAELEAQLQDFSTQYTEKNPKIISTRNQLSEINRQIAELSAGTQSGAPANSAEARELRGLQRELTRLETELAITRRELGRKKALAPGVTDTTVVASAPSMPSGSGGGAAAAEAAPMDAERLRKRLDSLLRKQETIDRMQGTAAGLDPGLFQIVDMPSDPQTPVGPDRTKLGLLALLVALGVGIAVAAAFEAPRLFSISDDRDVRYYLGAPVVALIPETLTPVERGRTRRLRLARGVVMLLLAAVLVPAFVFLLNYLQVFQLLASRW